MVTIADLFAAWPSGFLPTPGLVGRRWMCVSLSNADGQSRWVDRTATMFLRLPDHARLPKIAATLTDGDFLPDLITGGPATWGACLADLWAGVVEKMPDMHVTPAIPTMGFTWSARSPSGMIWGLDGGQGQEISFVQTEAQGGPRVYYSNTRCSFDAPLHTLNPALALCRCRAALR